MSSLKDDTLAAVEVIEPNKYARVNVQMLRDTKEKMQAYCKTYDLQMSKLINMLIYKYFYECNISNFDLEELRKNRFF